MTAPQSATPGCRRASAGENEPRDSTATAERTDAEQKRFATLRAKLALKGFELLETMHGTFIVSRWNLTRTCAGLAEAEQFAAQAGAL